MGLTACHQGAEYIWEGEALGAPGFIKLRGLPAGEAERLFISAKAEIKRLENIFSLNDQSSEISRLNKQGGLKIASPEMIEVVRAAHEISELTGGAFDITVQALWNLAQFLKRAKVTSEGAKKLWAEAYSRVDYRFVKATAQSVRFTKPGVAITLNGLAQGYITDKITRLLIKKGAVSGLVNIGEFRAFGPKAWNVGVQDPHNILDVMEVMPLKNASLATSSGKAGYLSEKMSHIFAPRTGHKAPQFISASVMHKTAMIADGLATAFTLMDIGHIRAAAKQAGAGKVLLVRENGEIIRV